jgi:hypothetical protein
VSLSTDITFGLLLALSYLLSPIMLIWGWTRWMERPKLRTVGPILSLIGFMLATASPLLGVSSIAYGVIHGFPYYDPLLLRIFRSGIMLSLGGIGFGISGVWRPS